MRTALLALLVSLLASTSHAFFGSDSREAFRALVRAKHTPALEDALCGKAMSITFARITVNDGITCPEEPYRDNGDNVIVSADDLAQAGFKIGFHEGEARLAYRGERFDVITREEVGRILEEVQKEEQRKRQDEAVSRFMPLQGTFTIDDVFSAMPH